MVPLLCLGACLSYILPHWFFFFSFFSFFLLTPFNSFACVMSLLLSTPFLPRLLTASPWVSRTALKQPLCSDLQSQAFRWVASLRVTLAYRSRWLMRQPSPSSRNQRVPSVRNAQVRTFTPCPFKLQLSGSQGHGLD
jgi:hypothetical protein